MSEDLAEPNNRGGPDDARENAYDLRTVEGTRELSGLSLYCDPDSATGDGACTGGRDVDWFVFQMEDPGQQQHKVRIDFDHRQGDLELALFDQFGKPLIRDDKTLTSESNRNFEEISLEGLPAGTPIYVKVYGYAELDGQLVTTSPDYTLTVIAPADTVLPDALEPNNTAPSLSSEGNATDLDEAAGFRYIPGLTIHTKETDGERDVDYFRFAIPGGARLTEQHNASIEFDQALGGLELQVLDANGQEIQGLSGTETTGYRTIFLAGLLTDANGDGLHDAEQVYYVRVQAAGGVDSISNRYALNFEGPEVSSGGQDAWTIMVYITASDLTQYAFDSINDLETAAALLPPNVNLAVFYDQSRDEPKVTPWRQDGSLPVGTDYGEAADASGVSKWFDAGWAIIQPDTDPERVATTFQRIGERNSGDPATLEEFMDWAMSAAPAERYGLVMWNHGAGLEGFNLDDRGGEDGDRMLASELALGLTGAGFGRQGTGPQRKLDLLAFDACLMAMAEVENVLSPYVTTIVASQDVEAATGYNYTAILSSSLGIRPDQVDGEALAAGFVAVFQEHYTANAQGADTHSAIATRYFEDFNAKLKAFTSAVTQDADDQDWLILREARLSAASFQNHPDYRDLRQFLDALAQRPVRDPARADGLHESIRAAAAAASDAMTPLIIAKTADGRDVGGLSIYLPSPGSDISKYLGTDLPAGEAPPHAEFFSATNWDQFLVALTQQVPGERITLDWAESNETMPKAFNLHRLVGDGRVFNGLSIHRSDDRDWFRFFIQTDGAAGDQVSVSLDGSASGQLTEVAQPGWRQTFQNLVERVSVARDGTEANESSDAPSISAEGRFVAFASLASNLVPKDVNEAQDVLVVETVARGRDRPVSHQVSLQPGETAEVNFGNQLVGAPPVLAPIGNRRVDEQTELSFVISATDADQAAGTLVYSAKDLPVGAAFDAPTRTFRWTPSEAQGPGSYEVTFTVVDGNGFATPSDALSVINWLNNGDGGEGESPTSRFSEDREGISRDDPSLLVWVRMSSAVTSTDSVGRTQSSEVEKDRLSVRLEATARDRFFAGLARAALGPRRQTPRPPRGDDCRLATLDLEANLSLLARNDADVWSKTQ
ncbi:MAG: clostripain-related cysteine peptidase [Pirellulales bacterium]